MQYILLYSILLVIIIAFVIGCKHIIIEEDPGNKNTLKPSDIEGSVFNSENWQRLDKEIRNGDYGLLHSVLVTQENKKAFESYYNNWEPHEIHDLQSATKSVASILIGIAIDKGYIKSVDQKLTELLPDYQFEDSDSLKKNIRLKDLLTMTAGLEWKEQSVKYHQPGNTLTDMYAQDKNWLDYILDLPVVNKPGTKFNYNSGVSILLGAILQENIDMSIQKFAEQYLFLPLEINKYQWSEYFGIAHFGGGLYLTSQDMAKLGNLYLNGGRWNNQQIVSKKWVDESIRPRFRASPDASYSYHWWTTGRLFNLKPIHYAAGDGWQFIYILKEFNLVIVTTGRNYTYEDPNTTLTQNELVFAILSTHSKFRKKINALFEQQQGDDKLTFYEVFFLGYSLNRLGAYEKTILFLSETGTKYEKDFRFNFLLGEAYFHTGDKEKARKYLEGCLTLCELHSYPENGYCQYAKDLIGQL